MELSFASSVKTEEFEDGSSLSGEYDPQDIPWNTPPMPCTRDFLRRNRLHSYHSYRSCEDDLDFNDDTLNRQCKFYEPIANHPQARCYYKHFQLRHLLHSTETDEVYLYNDAKKAIEIYSPILRTSRTHVNLSIHDLVSFYVCKGLTVCGGLNGSLVLHSSSGAVNLNNLLPEDSDTGIMNNVKIFEDLNSTKVMASSNDNRIRFIDAHALRLLKTFEFPSCVNHGKMSNCKKMIGAALDHKDCHIVSYDTGEVLFKLRGHQDFSFGLDWHPTNGYIVATGNQDMSIRVWDLRKASDSIVTPLKSLKGIMASVLNVQFSSNGEFLMGSECADFVHIYETSSYTECQTIDLFGEIAGACFSKEERYSDRLYIGIADMTYKSIVELRREEHNLESILI